MRSSAFGVDPKSKHECPYKKRRGYREADPGTPGKAT